MPSGNPSSRVTASSQPSLRQRSYETVENTNECELNSSTKERANDPLMSKNARVTYKDGESAREPSKPCKWTIGWLTPFIITVSFMLALLVAIAHYIYCRKLDKRPVDFTVKQRWNSTITTIFVRAFSLLLATSASHAFAQLLWWYLRRQHLSVSRIDALFSLSTGPLKLYRLDILRNVPVLWIFGLFLPLIPIAALFPSGALVVDVLDYPRNTLMSVPTLNIDDLGNGSAVAFFQHAMFSHGSDGEYRRPNDRYTGLARKTLLQGSVLTRPSPCGLDCSYDLTFSAPSLRCAEVMNMPNISDVEFSLTYAQIFKDIKDLDPKYYNYMGAPIISNDTVLGQSTDRSFVFAISYRAPNDDSYRSISCVTMEATYNTHVKYTNGVQSIALQVTNQKPLNASALNVGELVYDLLNSGSETDAITYPTRYSNQTKDEVLALMHGAQLRAMSDAMVNCLVGYILDYGSEGQQIAETTIQEMPLAVPIYNDSSYAYIDLRLRLSPSVLEELMRNTTLSIFNNATNMTNTEVLVISRESSYVFAEPFLLIGSYAAALVTCLVFVILGLLALIQNGVAADSGIFLQVLCATTNDNSTLNRLAREACLGGSGNHQQELLDLEVRFGEVRDNPALAAFGTVDEVTELKKGGNYG